MYTWLIIFAVLRTMFLDAYLYKNQNLVGDEERKFEALRFEFKPFFVVISYLEYSPLISESLKSFSKSKCLGEKKYGN